MGGRCLIVGAAVVGALLAAGFLFWRYVWFFRDPPRIPPQEQGIVSPADGTVVYARIVAPGEEVVTIKQGVSATVKDILREDLGRHKLVVGIFMSPFDVHYNRAPLTASIGFIRHHPALSANVHMGPMHLRTLIGRSPYYANSMHIVVNERTVTHFDGEYRGAPASLYVVQIGARTVNGIDSYYQVGQRVERGKTFGMIRIGSQVDLIMPWREGFALQVQPGDKVRAGETILIQ
ncbi:MAG TPA: phosphatidylserine decarboxylase [Acidiferrobacterales bacterium]|nr:phosphatidylserine decarboxylase [Acidiferrobacterales bacterium]